MKLNNFESLLAYHPTDDSLKAGTLITTSPVVAIDEGVVVITQSGTRYRFV